jgi:hypothetical protein
VACASPDWVGHSRIKDWSTDANGKAVRLRGVMFVPYAPSLFTYDMKNFSKDGRGLAQIEVVLGIFMAVPG